MVLGKKYKLIKPRYKFVKELEGQQVVVSKSYIMVSDTENSLVQDDDK